MGELRAAATAAEARELATGPKCLAELRQRAGLTQSQVAARMGISQSDLSKLERRTDLRRSTLRSYARALKGRVEASFTTGPHRTVIRTAGGARRSP